ncbi:MAG TPA: DUF5777 family beta-barrel protein [Vicinamibacteria bacterium]|nr:DUF5777 family beta-barrel protein [Vicinamibacteria bacterium]
MKLAWSGRLALVAIVAGAFVGVLPPAAAAQATSIDDREIDPVQPDFVVVNLPTNLRIPRHSFAFYLTHRFSRPLGEGDFSDLVSDFFGFDSGAKVGFGLRFGLFTATELSLYRTNDRAIQFGLKRDLLQQGEKPLSLGLQGAIEGRDNFSEIYSPALSLIASRKLGQRATLYAVPAYVGNVSANDADTGDDAFLLGLGGRLLVGHGVAILAEWTGHFGYDPPDPIDPRQQAAQAFTFGLEKRVGGHAFQLNFSNNFGSTYTSLARGGSQNDWFIGFNLSRKFY